MESQGRHIAQHGGDLRTRKGPDGRVLTFVPRAELAKLTREGKGEDYFSFSDQDVLDMLAINTRRTIVEQSKVARERMTKAGWARTKVVAPPAPAPVAAIPAAPPPVLAPKPANDDEDPDSPRLAGSGPPGPGKGNVITSPGLFSEADMAVLLSN